MNIDQKGGSIGRLAQGGFTAPGVLLLLIVVAAIGAGWLLYMEHARKQQQQEQAQARKQRMVSICHAEVRSRAKYQSKAVFTETLVDTEAAPVTVLGTVDFMNGFGAMIPFLYHCKLDDQGKTFVEPLFLMREGETPGEDTG